MWVCREQGTDRAWEGALVPALTSGKPGGARGSSTSPDQQARDELLGTAETGGKWHHSEAQQGL